MNVFKLLIDVIETDTVCYMVTKSIFSQKKHWEKLCKARFFREELGQWERLQYYWFFFALLPPPSVKK